MRRGVGSQEVITTDDRTAPEWIPLDEAACLTSVSVTTLKRWMKRGLPFYQAYPRGKRLVRLKDIEAFLSRRQHLRASINVGRVVDDVVLGLRG